MTIGMKHLKLIRKVGKGAFGSIFIAKDVKNNRRVACKIETKVTSRQLLHEYNIYILVQTTDNERNPAIMPKIYEFGRIQINNDFLNCMVMELLGVSLEKKFNNLKRRFSDATILMIGIRCIEQIKMLHSRNFLHRDIKPENFMLNRNEDSIYIIDLGLGKKFWDSLHNRHIPFRNDKNLTGTARYASVNTAGGCEQGRRDDLESLGYMLIYFWKGRLPWQGIKAETRKEKYEKIFKIKSEIKIKELCEECPKEMVKYMEAVRMLKFTDYPNYDGYIRLFKEALKRMGFEDHTKYEWLEEEK
ncbi:KC11 [Hepatospora eriocheir]|uniref:non-specific serine/threonine protein kinase n=1 Tax=Hepatospora eriocheir TaxID=1081669 RepID=A0A1X0QHQ4_9MICR|nr:KC11 [Hepatospora eriocheir]